MRPGSSPRAAPRSASSTSRRMASERPTSPALAHLSTSSINRRGIRAVTWGSLPPVEGRPRLLFFGATFIVLFINKVVPQLQAEGKVTLPPRVQPQHGNPNEPG